MIYQYTDDCRLGIPAIDEEHQKLFALINQSASMISMKPDEMRITAKNLITRLREYAGTHFAHEEAYMKQIKDPELESQQKEHQDFITRVDSFHLENYNNEKLPAALDELLQYLSHWLFHHIIASDTMIGKLDSPFAFTEKYHSGVAFIDEEHEKLFDIIREANATVHADYLHDKYDKIIEIIGRLKEYTEIHFHDEEVYMEEIGYPGLAAQKEAHTAFIDKLNDINLDELDDNQQGYLEHLIDFLLNWLSVHILQMDKKIGEYKKD